MDHAEEIARVIVGPLAEKAGVHITFDAHMSLIPQVADLIQEYGEQCRRAGAAAMREAADGLRAALQELVRYRKSVETDIWSAHQNRGEGAADWMREDDSDLRRDLRLAFDSASALLAMPLPPAAETASPAAGWRPIATAPKDGTAILVWCIHDFAKYSKDARAEGYEAAAVAHWIDHNGGGWTWNGLAGPPVFWMPLPDPPAPSEEARAG